MSEYLLIIWMLLGMLIGSFLNVVAIRVPRGGSLLRPPSQCESCGHRLHMLDLIPAASYIWLRARCRYCRSRVSPAYIAGECIAGAVYLLAGWRLGLQPELIVGLLFASVLIVVSITDMRQLLIPDRVLLFAIIAGLPLRIAIHPLPLWNYLAAFVFGGAVLYGIAWLGWRLTNKDVMGGGDIKLLAVIGLYIGLEQTLLTLLLASVLGLLFGAGLSLTGRLSRGQPLPFGPFLSAGALISYLWGSAMLDGYEQLLSRLMLGWI